MFLIDDEPVDELEKISLINRGIRSFVLCRTQEGEFSYRVKSLILSRNRLTSFVAEKGAFPNLTKLFLTYNQLTSFSTNEGVFPNLTRLFLGGNQLVSFSPKEGAFPKLKELYLSDNRLTLFVAEEGVFPNLERLCLSDNQLTSFVAEEGAFPKLEVLDIVDNPNLEVLEASSPNLRFLLIRDTKILFLDEILMGKIIIGKKVQAHYHARGTKRVVTESFHRDNPVVEEIVAHLTR